MPAILIIQAHAQRQRRDLSLAKRQLKRGECKTLVPEISFDNEEYVKLKY